MRWRLGAVGVAAFVALLAIEVWTDDEAASAYGLLGEALELALTVAAVAVVVVMLQRSRVHRSEADPEARGPRR